MNCTYVLCFLTRAGKVLLLHRNNPPNQGLWNGVGGRIEPAETPLAACLREVSEETGFHIETARYAGILTWEGFEIADGGLYLFCAEAPPGEPLPCSEGRLEWKPQEWLFTSPEVVENLHYVAPRILDGAAPARYHFIYRGGEIMSYEQLGPPPAPPFSSSENGGGED
jgi:8-oxo-dGTP diphosphatase